MAVMQAVDVHENHLECMFCKSDKFPDKVFIVDNTRDGKEKILNHLWEEHKYKGHVYGVS